MLPNEMYQKKNKKKKQTTRKLLRYYVPSIKRVYRIILPS